MLFLRFILYSPFFVATLKNEVEGAALEPCQLKIKQFSQDILKFSTKGKYNLLLLTVLWLFIFHADSRRMGSNNFRNSSYKEKTAGSARVSKLSFRFLWLWFDQLWYHLFCQLFWSQSFNNMGVPINVLSVSFKT